MPIPPWALWLSFWLHMLATVVWIGGLTTLAIIVLPSMRQILKPREFSNWLSALNKRLDPIGWLSLGILTFTGLIQMDSNPNYAGLLAVSNPWSQAIFLKHIAFVGMIAISAYSTWSVAPAIQRAALQRASRSVEADRAQDRLQRLIQTNLVLGVAILVLTGLARVS